jgi:hypothetical protein
MGIFDSPPKSDTQKNDNGSSTTTKTYDDGSSKSVTTDRGTITDEVHRGTDGKRK